MGDINLALAAVTLVGCSLRSGAITAALGTPKKLSIRDCEEEDDDEEDEDDDDNDDREADNEEDDETDVKARAGDEHGGKLGHCLK